MVGPDRRPPRRLLGSRPGVLAVVAELGRGHQRPRLAVQDVPSLPQGQLLVAADLLQRDREARPDQASALDAMQLGQGEGVDPHLLADDARQSPPQPKRKRELVIVHARVAIGRHGQTLAGHLQLYQVAVVQPHGVETAGRDGEGAAPGQPGDRIGELEQPSVVGGAAVEEREVGIELELQRRARWLLEPPRQDLLVPGERRRCRCRLGRRRLGRRRLGRRLGRCRLGRRRLGRRGALEEPLAEHIIPTPGRAEHSGLPVPSNVVVAGAPHLAATSGCPRGVAGDALLGRGCDLPPRAGRGRPGDQEVVQTERVVQRADHRLGHREDPLAQLDVTPRLQRVARGQQVVGQPAGLVHAVVE